MSRTDEALLQLDRVTVRHGGRRGTVHAVSDVTLEVRRGETLGLVGESGCGKSSLGRAILQLPPPTSGRVLFDGEDLTELRGESLRRRRAMLQPVFQDPISSLNPRRRVRDIVAEPLNVWAVGDPTERRSRADELLEAVGLNPSRHGDMRPREMSGGQCQRIAIARALALQPKLLICDEPVSALDVSVQAQILELLGELKQRYDLTILFIAHDLAVVKEISDRVAVMYLGRLCEVGPTEKLYGSPAHHYTAGLLDCIPVPDPSVPVRPSPLQGEMPSPLDPPSGCAFRTRCDSAEARCAEDLPLLGELHPAWAVACHLPLTSPVQG